MFKFDKLIFLHGDDQYHVKYVPKLLNSLNDKRFSAATGSRLRIKKNALKGKMPIYKFIGNIVLTSLFNFVTYNMGPNLKRNGKIMVLWRN